MSTTKPTAFASLCASVKTIVRRMIDGGDVTDARLAAVEARLAALDGGDEAPAARRKAIAAVSGERADIDGAPLSMKVGADGKLQFIKS